jgi:serine/threonine protein kinase
VDHTKTERNVLARVQHPFIVSLRFAFQTNNKLYLILDWFAGGELFHHLREAGRFKQDRARFYVAEIALAFGYLHDMEVVYRDLKPENILLDAEGHVRLTDFGLSKDNFAQTETTTTFCGTPEYLAPEIVMRQAYTMAVDWWALGVLLYELLVGQPPFYHSNQKMLFDRITKGVVSFPEYVRPAAKDLIKSLLQVDPTKRLGHEKVSAVLFLLV